MNTRCISAVSVLLSLASLVLPQTGFALSCLPPPGFADAVEQYDAVIEARPLRLIETTETTFVWEVEVGTVYKGNVAAHSKTAVQEQVWPSTKDTLSTLAEGVNMLFFLQRDEDTDMLTIGLCNFSGRSLDQKPLTAEERRMLTGTALPPFRDVPSAHANAEAIAYVRTQGIVHGYPDGTFGPDKTINRAEFVKIVAGHMDSEGVQECEQLFPTFTREVIHYTYSDVPIADWYAKYVCAADRAAIVIGYPDGSFRPANTINFAEAAKILVKAFGIGSEQSAMELEGEAEHPGQFWYKPFTDDMSARNAIPVSIQNFAHEVTRGEMAEMVYRLKAKVTTKLSKTYDDLAPQPTVQDEFGS